MNILICNDDGITSEGIHSLARILSKKHNVLVVAPSVNRSALSHSLSISTRLFLSRIETDGAYEAYSFSGTPADCVKFVEHVFTDFKIDLVVAGVNKGHNLGSDILYSGTVSAAFEAAYFGHIAMAFSSVTHECSDFAMCSRIAEKLIDKLLPYSVKGTVWNINIPGLKENEIKGVVFTELGKQIYSDEYKKVGEGEYILIGHPLEHKENIEDCDVEWSRKGYITVTPLLFNKTDYKKLSEITNFQKEIQI